MGLLIDEIASAMERVCASVSGVRGRDMSGVTHSERAAREWLKFKHIPEIFLVEYIRSSTTTHGLNLKTSVFMCKASSSRPSGVKSILKIHCRALIDILKESTMPSTAYTSRSLEYGTIRVNMSAAAATACAYLNFSG